jgi:flagellar motor protein MotB
MASRAHVVHLEEEESYFMSMTDVAIGLLFVFIIMLMFFAMRFQEATKDQQEATRKQNEVIQAQSEATLKQIEVTQAQNELIDDLTDAEKARNSILREIGAILQKNRIEVLVVEDEGILRFSEEILFEKGSWELNSKKGIGREALMVVADALDHVLPCYTTGTRSRVVNCPRTKAKVEAIFIEGHADSDAYRGASTGEQRRRGTVIPLNSEDMARSSSAPFPFLQGTQLQTRQSVLVRRPVDHPPRDNLDLSALRATTTYRELLRVKPELTHFQSPNSTPVLSVSGYGQDRPLPRKADESDEEYKKRNRRIDLRIIMAAPRSKDAKEMQRQIDQMGKTK